MKDHFLRRFQVEGLNLEKLLRLAAEREDGSAAGQAQWQAHDPAWLRKNVCRSWKNWRPRGGGPFAWGDMRGSAAGGNA